MRKNLTAKLIDNLQPRPDRRYEVRDAVLPGFGVRVNVTGKKTWFAIGRYDARLLRHTIGSYPTVSLAEARDVARTILRDMQLGAYAAPQVAIEKALPTLANVIAEFIEIYAKQKNRGWKATRATLRKFCALENRPIAEITRTDIVKVLDGSCASGAPIAANRAMSAIKKLFSWALDRGVITVHPIIGMRAPSKENTRDRVLTDEEIAAFWHAAEDMGFPFGPAFQLMLLTGQRRGEVTSMRWSQIEGAVWTIPASVAKNGRAHQVPLSALALYQRSFAATHVRPIAHAD